MWNELGFSAPLHSGQLISKKARADGKTTRSGIYPPLNMVKFATY